jgi:hypothetical protein
VLLEQKDFDKVYNYDFINEKMSSYGVSASPLIRHNIPTNALVLLPLTWLSPHQAKLTWTIISVVLLVISLVILFKLYRISINENLGIGLLAIIFLLRPIYENWGQIYFLLLFLFSLSMLGLVHMKQRTTAFSLSTIFFI